MSSWPWSLWIVLTILAPSQAQDSPYPDANDPAGQNAAGAAGSAGNSFISNKTRNLIIILSVVVGVVVIMAVGSAILYVIAKRRQWAVREAIRRSARRVTDAIKSPLTPRFPKSSAPGASRPKRSSRGMTKIETPQDTRSMSVEQKTPSGQKNMQSQSYRDVDLERAIELGSTKTTSVRVSTRETTLSKDSKSGNGWGSMFAFGRH